jgi:hypothetical protein
VIEEAQSFKWRDEAIIASYLSIHHGGNSLKKPGF